MTDIGKILGDRKVETFLGVPAAAVADAAHSITILGIPSATPYAASGPYSAKGPEAMRRAIARYASAISHYDFDLDGPLLPPDAKVFDCGDLGFDPSDFAGNRNHISSAIRQLHAKGNVPVILGGDDSISIPILEGLSSCSPLVVLQIDAHVDWRHDVQGETLGLSSTMRRASEMKHVTRIVQAGQRGIGSARPQDVADARAWGVNFMSARQIHAEGIAAVVDAIPSGSRVFIDFDVDALDPSLAPGVIGRAPGGLTYHQALGILHGVAAKAEIVGFAIVELCPERDHDDMSALIAARIVCNVIGLLARQKAA